MMIRGLMKKAVVSVEEMIALRVELEEGEP
jgi:hypothetical protein